MDRERLGTPTASIDVLCRPVVEFSGDDKNDGLPGLAAVQLTMDHSTCVEEEVHIIRTEHREDASAIANDRVKGSLKVTRAFSAGFLKQEKNS